MTAQLAPAFLHISADDFRMDSDEVRAARSAHWYAETDYGLAVLSYADNAALMKDRRLSQGSTRWPAHHGVTGGSYHDWWRRTLLVLEGIDHHRIRRLVNPSFSPRRLEPLYPAFEHLAEDLVDGWIGDGRAEFVADFAAPYSTRVLCLMLGIDDEEWPRIYRLSTVIGLGIGVTVKENIAEIDRATRELTDFAEQLIRDRRQTPREDILTMLARAGEGDEGRLSDDELVNLVILLIFAGIDTTRNQLTLAVESYSRQPDQWEKLAGDPDRYAARAVEEALRTNPIARWVTREATESFSHRERIIEQGTTVHMFTLSSGTDPQEYTDPDRIDLDAERSPHFAFGGGIHHCLGHFVARADLNVALVTLATRLTGVEIGTDTQWLPDSGNTGADAMPITFTARERRLIEETS